MYVGRNVEDVCDAQSGESVPVGGGHAVAQVEKLWDDLTLRIEREENKRWEEAPLFVTQKRWKRRHSL